MTKPMDTIVRVVMSDADKRARITPQMTVYSLVRTLTRDEIKLMGAEKRQYFHVTWNDTLGWTFTKVAKGQSW